MTTAHHVLNRAKAREPRVFSLHDAQGATREVFASSDRFTIAGAMHTWRPALAQGWTAIEWRHGEIHAAFADAACKPA